MKKESALISFELNVAEDYLSMSCLQTHISPHWDVELAAKDE